jgi:hypothetical protein
MPLNWTVRIKTTTNYSKNARIQKLRFVHPAPPVLGAICDTSVGRCPGVANSHAAATSRDQSNELAAPNSSLGHLIEAEVSEFITQGTEM